MSWRIIPPFVLIVSLAVLLVSILPAPLVKNQMEIDSAAFHRESLSQVPEAIRFQLSYPRWIRVDENRSVLLTIHSSGTHQGDLQGWQARLEINGVVISPQGESRQRAIVGEETLFRWNIRPFRGDAGHATVWIYQVRKSGINQERADLVLAYPFEIRILNWMGGSGWMGLRLLSGGGVFISLLWWWRAGGMAERTRIRKPLTKK